MRRPAPVPVPEEWAEVPLWAKLTRRNETGRPELPLLSVYRDYGVIPRDSRDDNYNKASLDLSGYQVVRPGDVVANKMKTWQGSIAVSDLQGLVSPAYLIFALDSGIHSRFLHYLLRSRPYVAEYGRLSYGVRPAQWDLRWDDMRNIRLLLPPPEMQIRIADLLDRETARIDALVDKKRRLIDLLEEKRTATITEAVTRGLDPATPRRATGVDWIGDVPAHWDALSLSRISLQITNGYVGPTRDILEPAGVPYIQSLHIKRRRVVHDGKYFVSEDWHRLHDRTRLREGDILIVQTGDIGSSAVVDADTAGANCHALIIIRLHPELADPAFIDFAIRSEGGQAAVLSTKTGATHPHLNVGYVRDIPFPIPPLPEQKRIVSVLGELWGATEEAIRLIGRQADILIEYRQSLITSAVTGNLDLSAYDREHGLDEVVA